MNEVTTTGGGGVQAPKPNKYAARLRYLPKPEDDGVPTWGYLDQKTIVALDGSPPIDLKADEGIFLHYRDCDRPLRIDMEVVFRAVPDQRREGGFRAERAMETATSRLKGLVEGGIELLVPKRTLQDPMFFMTWCLSPSIMSEVREKLLRNEKIALLISQVRLTGDPNYPIADEKRQLILLDGKTNMSAMSFNGAGRHRIVAAVVSGSEFPKMRETYLKMWDRNRHNLEVIAYTGDCLSIRHTIGSGSIDVEIPLELFGDKPRDYAWVNAYFKNPPKDECRYFWYRRVPIYLLQLVRMPFMFVWSVINIMLGGIIGAGLWCLYRGVAFKALLRHPYRMPISYVWNDLRESRVAEAKKHRLGRFLLSPLVWFLAAVLVYLHFVGPPQMPQVVVSVGTGVDMGALLKTAIQVVGVLAVSVLLGLLIVYGAKQVDWKKMADDRRYRNYERERERSRIREERRREAVELQVRDLVCTATGPRKPDAKLLSWGPGTIIFKVLDFKRKRCRNFSA